MPSFSVLLEPEGFLLLASGAGLSVKPVRPAANAELKDQQMKRFGFALAVVSLSMCPLNNAATFQDIQFWTGSGTHQAGFKIDWNDGTTNVA